MPRIPNRPATVLVVLGLTTFLSMAHGHHGLVDSRDPKNLPTPAKPAAKPVSWKQKDFFITFWCPPPANDQALAAVAAEHFNLTWVPAEGLDVAAKHGLRHADQ